MKQYHHLFFDLDHTLWDFDRNSEATWRLLWEKYGLAERGIPGFEAFFERYNHHNDRMWARFRAGHMKREELRWKRVWHALLDFRVSDMKLVEALSVDYLELLPLQNLLTPGARTILDYSRDKGYTMHLITNGFEATQQQKLANAGIADYFVEMFSSERCNSMKPHAGIFEFALQHTGAVCKDSLMIGDALDIDVLGAAGVGMDQVYYNPQRLPHREKPTYEIADWEELKAVV